jgi:dipeptidyl aminopeptidase/acylaminoacyl peptidase
VQKRTVAVVVRNSSITRAFAILLALSAPRDAVAIEIFSPEDVFKTRLAAEVSISPDGTWVAYTVRCPRKPADEPGADYRELHVVSTRNRAARPYVTGEVEVKSPRFSPDGMSIAFLMKRGAKAKTQVWVIPVAGGEARQATRSETDVSFFHWHPDGKQIGYLATSAPTKRDEKLKDEGYEFVFFEEDLRHRNLYLISLQSGDEKTEAKQITQDITLWTFEFSPDGAKIAASASEKNLVDHEYMFRKIYLVDASTGALTPLTHNPGKLGNFAFNRDGRKLVYAAARDQRDHAVSQAYVIDTAGGEARNVTPEDLRGHVRWVAWRDKDTVLFMASEGVWNTLSAVRAGGGKRQRILYDAEIVFDPPSFTRDFRYLAMTASTPEDPSNVYLWTPGESPKRLTDLNPWITDRKLGGQEVVRYPARDGLEIEALLIYPAEYVAGTRYPLIVVVHGGPESHYSNEWQTNYSQPAQVYAGRGYLVFLPNYRSSTGYGVDFTRDHLGDPAGKEFDDIADGIDFLVDSDLADPDRVGLIGGSYGGYAAAWFSSYYTQYVRAVCMMVGISDLISKRGTTDIPYEELYVHSGDKLDNMWELSLKRSPVYYAHQSRTAVLILGGTNDTRVHPSQSLEYYRQLKMNNHPAVRLVRYPGEGHGNSKQPGRIDALHRAVQWCDWYVRDAKPLDGPMPPLDISENYGLELKDK